MYLRPRGVELITEISKEGNEYRKAQINLLLHFQKCNFAAWEWNWDIHRKSGEQPINRKCDISKALFRQHMLRRYIIAIICCMCARETQKQ